MKKALSLILALVLCLSLCACSGGNDTPETTEEPTEATQASTTEAPTETTEPSYTKELIFRPARDLQSYTVTGLSGIPSSTEIVIPSVYNGYPVTAIGFSVSYMPAFEEHGPFYGYSGITSVTIPNSVTTIGFCAFAECTGLTSITIPDSVTTISQAAFYGCTNLTSITIPDSVTEIDRCAFENCTGLKSITIPDSVTEIGDSAFGGCNNLTIYGAAGSYIETYAKERNIPFETQ